MNKAAFNKALADTPLHVPVFKLTKLPKWLEGYADVGDEFFYIRETFVHRQHGTAYDLGVTFVRFTHYAQFTAASIRHNRGF